MRQLIQHRLKTNIIGRTGHVQPRGKFVKKPLLSPVPLKAIQGWTGLENCFTASEPAVFAGNSLLRLAIASSSESPQGTISMWIKNEKTVLQNLRTRVYDIGDDTQAQNETTRLNIDVSNQVDSRISQFNDPTWSALSIINNIGFVVDEWHHYYLTWKNNTIGDLDDKMQIYVDGVQSGIDESISPPNGTTSYIGGDNIVIGARHDTDGGGTVNEGFIGVMAEIWTSPEYMEPVENIPFFRSATTTPEFVNGTPKPVSSVVNGFSANIFLGGSGYTITDWNNGVNRGLLSDFELIGDPLELPA